MDIPLNRETISVTLPRCEVCGFEIQPEGYCSNFCATTTDEQKAAFKALKVEDWGIYPCANCGTAIEDMYPGPGSICSSCGPEVKLKRCQKLLEEIVPVVEGQHPLIAKRIREELQRS
jgi:DNA-directed RNA polymerase subunit RPC12/RpoP